MAKRDLVFTHKADELPDLIYIEEAAYFLDASKRVLREKCSNDEEGGIPFIHVGNAWQIPKPRFLEWCKITKPVNLDLELLAKRIIEGVSESNTGLLNQLFDNLTMTISFGVKTGGGKNLDG